MRFDLRPGVRRLFRLPWRTRATLRAEIDEELDSLIASRVDDLVARGLSVDAARAEAFRHLGASLDDARRQLHQSAEYRERRMLLREHAENLWQDVRYAARGLVRRPGFTAVAVITLAIGLGATTAIFSAVNVMLLRPLPYPRPDELMKVSLVTPTLGARPGRPDMVWSYPKFTFFRDNQQDFTELSLYTPQQFAITSGDVERITGEFVGATYFRTIGLTPSRGRDFDRSIDAAPGAPKQAILTTAFWRRRFNADPAVIGKTIDLDGSPYAIIGIAPEDFQGLTNRAEVFVPITTRAAQGDLEQAQSHEFYLVARRKPGVTVTQAATDVTVLGKRVNAAFVDSRFGGGVWGAGARPLNDARVAPLIRRSLVVLFGAVGLVLLIACVNVANLQLGRASARRREIAVRLAIGAGRARIVRLLVTESVLLAVVGGVAAVGVAWVATRALGAINPAVTSRAAGLGGLGTVSFASIHFDWVALAFTFALALVVGLTFGLVPAFSATRTSLNSAMKDASAPGHGVTLTGRRMLVVAEVALAMVLLAGSGLMIHSLTKLLAIDNGFDANNVLTVRLSIPPGTLARDSQPQFYAQMLDRLRALPGVTDASIANCTPLNAGCNQTKLQYLDGREEMSFEKMPSVGIHFTSPTWFSTMRIPVKAGRVYGDGDQLTSPKVVVVNETAAKKLWPNANPIGQRIAVMQGGFDKGAEVIGVVGSVRQFVDSQPMADVYVSYNQAPRAGLIIFLKTARDPGSLGNDVRRALREIAPRFPTYDVQTMATRTVAATAQARFSAVLLALFAATALSLAVVGIYGVMSLGVTARTREIGIRIALGAEHARVQRLIVGEGIALVAAGAAIGLAGALLATRLLKALLFDLAPTDPVTYAAIVVLIGVAAVAASWLPARRATRVDPVQALRSE